MTLVGRLHGGLVFPRRVASLSRLLSALVPRAARLLDFGCGDGLLASLMRSERPDIEVRGADVLVRERTHIPVDRIEGERLPYEDRTFDAVMMIDVLHHTRDPVVQLREASRVSRGIVLIKDHLADPWLAVPRLRFMDFVGNAHHGVALTYNYWPSGRWHSAFREANLAEEVWNEKLGLYPWPASLLFEDGLHFIARLRQGN